MFTKPSLSAEYCGYMYVWSLFWLGGQAGSGADILGIGRHWIYISWISHELNLYLHIIIDIYRILIFCMILKEILLILLCFPLRISILWLQLLYYSRNWGGVEWEEISQNRGREHKSIESPCEWVRVCGRMTSPTLRMIWWWIELNLLGLICYPSVLHLIHNLAPQHNINQCSTTATLHHHHWKILKYVYLFEY